MTITAFENNAVCENLSLDCTPVPTTPLCKRVLRYSDLPYSSHELVFATEDAEGNPRTIYWTLRPKS